MSAGYKESRHMYKEIRWVSYKPDVPYDLPKESLSYSADSSIEKNYSAS